MNVRLLSPTSIWRTALVATVLLGVALVRPVTAQDVPATQTTEISALSLQGSLPSQTNAHYLGLEPSVRDGVVVLTLTYDPSTVRELRGKVNFTVLTEDGLRKFLAGSDYRDLGIADGASLQFDPIGNKLRAAFKDSGRGRYTVIVSNAYGVVTSAVARLTVVQPAQLTAVGSAGGPFQMELTVQPGVQYSIEGSTNLLNWELLETFIATNSPVLWSDTDATNFMLRFYRSSASAP